ncbi:hypothetical protein SSX86_030573 [Deinandra increscens subsp. villosa]|uniref:Wall-associated receptor kinase galacturonan-binding domain-containing protein n=1 Tax=Deinandra increscens subsp. villosa TaxID=3103831 RepID=A0AAP0GI65_9ASTR
MNKLYQVYTLLILLSITSTKTSSAALSYAKNGCKDKCGNVTIPYPFGIGAKCYFNEWYTVDCNSSTPYLSSLNHIKILGVDLENQTVTVNTPMLSDCNQTNSIDLGASPFLFSKLGNKFVFEGCGSALITMDHGSLFTGCSTTCRNDSSTAADDKHNCLGNTCCETTVPHYLKSYSTNITGFKRLGGERANCRSALFVDEISYIEGRFSIGEDNSSYVPISLLWTLPINYYSECCSFSDNSLLKVDLGNGTSWYSGQCSSYRYMELEGNLYLRDGCRLRKECAECRDSGGFCRYDPEYSVDGLVSEKNFTCDHGGYSYDERKSPSGVIILAFHDKSFSSSLAVTTPVDHADAVTSFYRI